MIAQNHKKSKKFRFEDINELDFSWEINPGDINLAKEPVYSRFLSNVYRYDPSKHDFDTERFFTNNSK